MAAIITGVQTGVDFAPNTGVNPSSAPAADTDATSGKYVPSTAGQFTALGITAPNHLWLCQEASGNLSDTIGAVTLTANGTPLYQQTVTGWTRKGVGFNEAANQRFGAAAALGPNVGTTSVLWLGYARVASTPTGNRTILGPNISGTNACKLEVTTAPYPRANINGGVSLGSTSVSTSVQPFAILLDRTNSRAAVYTSQEKVAGTYSALVADGMKGLGAAGGSSWTGQCVWMAAWAGASAEISDAQVKTLLQTLGWTIPWS